MSQRDARGPNGRPVVGNVPAPLSNRPKFIEQRGDEYGDAVYRRRTRENR